VNANDPYGHSLALVNGDIVFQGGRIVEVSGQDNLLQALELRVLTPFGSDIFNTTYGLDVRQIFVEPNDVRMVQEIIKLNLVRTISLDPRVRDIRDISFIGDAAYLEQHPDLSEDALEGIRIERRRRSWRVEVVVETIQGQTETLATTVGV
jgi:phage baseplate assembly protein W